MKKIIVCVGISGSGKSTWAHEQVKENPQKYVIANRDKLRELLFGYTEANVQEYYSRPDFRICEKQVTKHFEGIIDQALAEDKIVICDNTHLDPKYIAAYKIWNVPIEIKWFDVLRKEAVVRNAGRARRVDESVIHKQYDQYIKLRENFTWDYSPVKVENDPTLPPCILVDLDGTLCRMSDRSPYDWHRVGEDTVDLFVKILVNGVALSQSPAIFVCTGRDGVCIDECVKWLDEHNVHYNKIFIRKKGDMRPDWVVKGEIWQQITKDYHILGLIDDRQQVVRHARGLGLKVAQVEYNNF